jgi:hypothetical protein
LRQFQGDLQPFGQPNSKSEPQSAIAANDSISFPAIVLTWSPTAPNRAEARRRYKGRHPVRSEQKMVTRTDRGFSPTSAVGPSWSYRLLPWCTVAKPATAAVNKHLAALRDLYMWARPGRPGVTAVLAVSCARRRVGGLTTSAATTQDHVPAGALHPAQLGDGPAEAGDVLKRQRTP